jgi:hypothetical protein
MSDAALSPQDLLFNVRNRIVNAASMAVAYRESWTPDFGIKEIAEAWESGDAPYRLKVDDLIGIGDDDLYALGFRTWDGALTLIPLWAYRLIADGEVLHSINGDTGTVGAMTAEGRPEIDLDVRFGCIAYGFTKPAASPHPDVDA